MDGTWKSDLARWLAPFLSAFRHKARARMCPVYVAGLIGAGDRKSVQPMAARDGEVGYDQLHHFIASGVWDAAPLEKALLAEADRMVGGGDAWLCRDGRGGGFCAGHQLRISQSQARQCQPARFSVVLALVHSRTGWHRHLHGA